MAAPPLVASRPGISSKSSRNTVCPAPCGSAGGSTLPRAAASWRLPPGNLDFAIRPAAPTGLLPMKSPRLSLLLWLAAALTAPLPAQPVKTPVVKAVETAREAYVNSTAFAAEGTGIKQLEKAMQALELEFSGKQSELSLLGEKLRTLAIELNKLNAVPWANATAIESYQAAGARSDPRRALAC